MKLSLRRPAMTAAALFLFGCSSAPSDVVTPDAALDVQIEAASVECAPAPPSKCSPQRAGSVVRGVITVDPTHFKPGAKVNLAVFLYHEFVMYPQEASYGGHLHGYKYIKNVDVSSGQVPFDIDDCELGTAMYSEENCGFNLVVMFDETGNNDPDAFGESAFAPSQGQLVKLTPLNISCHGDSQCLAITADCTGGTACTTITPRALSACVCSADSCPSQSVICTAAPQDAGSD